MNNNASYETLMNLKRVMFVPDEVLEAKEQNRFEPESITVVVLAQEEARRMNHNFVSGEQLLTALTIGRGWVSKLLESVGVGLKISRHEVEKIIDRGSGSALVDTELLANSLSENIVQAAMSIPFTSEAKNILAYACDEANKLKSTKIGSRHILLGLIRFAVEDQEKIEHTVVLKVLQNLQVDLTRLKTDALSRQD